MPEFSTHFTVSEARSLLPWVQERLEKAKALIAELGEAHVEMARIRKLVSSNGHGAKQPGIGDSVKQLQQIVDELVSRGIEIKDLETGLIDFPHMKDGDEVLLCYRLGEPDIEFWHTLEGGFAGRRPI